jgi:hypothetical protein
MARTESKSIQVHPYDEQSQIDLMQKFHWNLLNSQEIKNIDNRLERRGDSIYQVSNTEHYVKLVFSRDLDVPNLHEIKRLEQEFFSLPYPDNPRAFGCFTAQMLVILFIVVAIAMSLALESGAIGTVLSFILIVGGYAAYLFMYYIPKKQEVDQIMAQTNKRGQELLAAVAQYD